MSLGNNIYNLRAKADLSQEELAAKLGVSRQSVSKWETDASVPDVDKLIQLSKIFEITLDELVNGEENQQQADIIRPEATQIENGSAVKDSSFKSRKIVGAVLIGVSLFAVFLSLIFMSDITPIIVLLSVYFLLCGIICVIMKKSIGRLILSIVALTVLYACVAVLLFSVFYMRISSTIVY